MVLRRTALLLLLLALLAAVLPSGARADQPLSSPDAGGGQGDAAVQQRLLGVAVAANLGASADLQVGATTVSHYPLTAITLYHAKVRNLRTGATLSVALDPRGNAVDARAALENELAARRTRFGKLDAPLYDALQPMPDDAPLRVSIWLRTDEPSLAPDRPAWLAQTSPLPTRAGGLVHSGLPTKQPPVPSLAEVDAALQEEQRHSQAAVAAVAAPLAAQLRAQGVLVSHVSQYVPVVYATMTKAALLALQEHESVVSIGLVQQAANQLDTAQAALHADWVWASLFTGMAVPVGVLEVGGRVAIDNPYLWGVEQDPVNVADEPQDHATAVTGMIRSRHAKYRGIAYGSRVRVGGSAGGWLDELEQAADRAVAWGAKVLNNSWGHSDPAAEMSDSELYWEHLVHRTRKLVCFAAGNTGRAEANIIHPGMAYNVVTVGAYNDHNSDEWADDDMAAFSSYNDPASAHNDREKPDLCAPGANIESTTTRAPWVGDTGSGTSYASPMVAATAAIMLQRNPQLAAWPEAVKALLMAASWNNMEGERKLSEEDGAGGLDTLSVVASAGRPGYWGAMEVTQGNFDGSGYLYVPITVPADHVVRAAIAWCVDPSYSGYPLEPQADFDLSYLDEDGSMVDISESYDNNAELVVVTTSGGQRWLRIKAERISTDKPTRLAWAWTSTAKWF